MKYKCLVLDHDDTAVKSTPELHYPSFQEIMKIMRPNIKCPTLQEFIRLCYDPGFGEYCMNVLDFDEKEMEREFEIWIDYIKDKTPHFYEGFLDIVKEFQAKGGYVCVVSHSESSQIIRHYRENGVELDLVYGWEYPKEQRKPYAYPMEQIMEKLSLEPRELVMVDDLIFGYKMAKLCNVDFVAAGWSQSDEEIIQMMKENCDYYFKTVEELSRFLFKEE